MGFYLRCAIAKVDDPVLADRIRAGMRELLPSFVGVRRFASPFAGVIAAYDHVHAAEEILEDWAKHGYADEDAATEDVYETIQNHMADLSHEFPDVPFAFVEVDCFGGNCRFDGYVVKNGLQTHREESSASAHQRLFAHLGVVDPPWHFAPFTRGFMESGVASDLDREAITYYVHARWDEPLRLAAMRAAMLPPPWRVTIANEKSCIVVYGEQFVASLNAFDDHVRLDAKSFVDLALTKTLAHELTLDDVALELRDADGKLV